MAETKSAKAEGLMYKGHPLRRVENLIYYGTMAEKYIIMMQVLDTKKEQDLEVATKVSVQLQLKKAKKTACMPPWTWPPSGWTVLWPVSKRPHFPTRYKRTTKGSVHPHDTFCR